MTYENNPEYQGLLNRWRSNKALEVSANADRIKTEKAILAMVGKDLNEKGTNNFPYGLKITTGMTESWDMKIIDSQFNEYENGTIKELPFFPFDKTLKANNKKLALLKEENSKAFYKIFSEALTIKPKKPAFEIKEMK